MHISIMVYGSYRDDEWLKLVEILNNSSKTYGIEINDKYPKIMTNNINFTNDIQIAGNLLDTVE